MLLPGEKPVVRILIHCFWPKIFDDLKFKSLQLKKIAKYFFLGLREELPSFKRIPLPMKRTFSSSNMKFFPFVLFFGVVFAFVLLYRKGKSRIRLTQELGRLGNGVGGSHASCDCVSPQIVSGTREGKFILSEILKTNLPLLPS